MTRAPRVRVLTLELGQSSRGESRVIVATYLLWTRTPPRAWHRPTPWTFSNGLKQQRRSSFKPIRRGRRAPRRSRSLSHRVHQQDAVKGRRVTSEGSLKTPAKRRR